MCCISSCLSAPCSWASISQTSDGITLLLEPSEAEGYDDETGRPERESTSSVTCTLTRERHVDSSSNSSFGPFPQIAKTQEACLCLLGGLGEGEELRAKERAVQSPPAEDLGAVLAKVQKEVTKVPHPAGDKAKTPGREEKSKDSSRRSQADTRPGATRGEDGGVCEEAEGAGQQAGGPGSCDAEGAGLRGALIRTQAAVAGVAGLRRSERLRSTSCTMS